MTFQGFGPDLGKFPGRIAGAPRHRALIRQSASSTSTTVTLPALPLPGSLLVAGFANQQGTLTWNASGGGVASWSRIDAHWDSGSQVRITLYLGVVGSSPSASVSFSGSNVPASGLLEICNLLGTIDAQTGNVLASETLVLPTISAGVGGGAVLYATANRLGGSTPSSTSAGTIEINRANGTTVRLQMGMLNNDYATNDPITLSFGNVGSTLAGVAVIVR